MASTSDEAGVMHLSALSLCRVTLKLLPAIRCYWKEEFSLCWLCFRYLTHRNEFKNQNRFMRRFIVSGGFRAHLDVVRMNTSVLWNVDFFSAKSFKTKPCPLNVCLRNKTAQHVGFRWASINSSCPLWACCLLKGSFSSPPLQNVSLWGECRMSIHVLRPLTWQLFWIGAMSPKLWNPVLTI